MEGRERAERLKRVVEESLRGKDLGGSVGLRYTIVVYFRDIMVEFCHDGTYYYGNWEKAFKEADKIADKFRETGWPKRMVIQVILEKGPMGYFSKDGPDDHWSGPWTEAPW